LTAEMSGSEFKLDLPRVHPAGDVFALLANRPTAQFSRIWPDLIIYSHKHSCWMETPSFLTRDSLILSAPDLDLVWRNHVG
jgi:hypothetical protein